MKADRPLAGILWMLVTGGLFVALTVLVKHAGAGLPAVQTAFLRFALGLVFVIPVIRPLMRMRPTPRQWRLFGLRGAVHTAAVTLWFFSMTQITVAEVVAMEIIKVFTWAATSSIP